MGSGQTAIAAVKTKRHYVGYDINEEYVRLAERRIRRFTYVQGMPTLFDLMVKEDKEDDELAKHCMEDIDLEFAAKVESGDIIVATTNFGCGSSREHAPLAIKASGISCVIAQSFARIFFRNAINIGLSLLECAESVAETEAGDILEVDLSTGKIKNISKNKTVMANPYPEFMMDIIDAGGLIEYTKHRLQSI
jgi:3-isopropylmalate/(R)-2-methylmalate dehydratase small subunit